jgi:hypothetical protein
MLPPPDRPLSIRVPTAPALRRRLTDGSIRSVIWTTGYQADFSWLDMPVFDRKGQLLHQGGVVPCPGLYVMGLPFLRRRSQSYFGCGTRRRGTCWSPSRKPLRPRSCCCRVNGNTVTSGRRAIAKGIRCFAKIRAARLQRGAALLLSNMSSLCAHFLALEDDVSGREENQHGRDQRHGLRPCQRKTLRDW